MRDIDDQLREVLHRADQIKEKETLRKAVFRAAAGAFVCAVLLALAAYYLPFVPVDQVQTVESRYGSLLLAAPYLGHVIIGLIAFALGVCVTLLCIRIRQMKEKEQE